MSKIDDVARAIDPMSAKVADMLIQRGLSRKDVLAILPMDKARAAIEAMREPEVEMIAAFWRQKNCGTQEVGQVGDARSDYDAWRAAIDAALSEEGR